MILGVIDKDPRWSGSGRSSVYLSVDRPSAPKLGRLFLSRTPLPLAHRMRPGHSILSCICMPLFQEPELTRALIL